MLSNLDHALSYFVGIVLIFVFLFVFISEDFSENLTTYLLIMGVIGVFAGNGFGALFDSISFVFFIAPYSIGDKVNIGGEYYQITQIKLSHTTADNGFGLITYFKNADLLHSMTSPSNRIQNWTRSSCCTHSFDIYLSQNTTRVQLQELKQRFEEWCATRMATDTHSLNFIVHGVDKQCRLKILIYVGTYISFSDGVTRWRQHDQCQQKLRDIILEMDIQYIKTCLFADGMDD